MKAVTDLSAVNAMNEEQFTMFLGSVFEHSPWIPRAAYTSRPFASVEALHQAMFAVVVAAGEDRRLALLRAHPELARPGKLTAASTAEQGGMGLDRLAADEAGLFSALNAQYAEKFGFPFIIAVRGQRDRTAILAALTARLKHSAEQEVSASLAEVKKITRFRLDDLIGTQPDV